MIPRHLLRRQVVARTQGHAVCDRNPYPYPSPGSSLEPTRDVPILQILQPPRLGLRSYLQPAAVVHLICEFLFLMA